MAFFLIVPSVMIVSIVLAHTLAKRLGLKIYYSTLIAVALLSFVVIFGAVSLSPVPDKRFLLCLGGLVTATSLLLALLNRFLIKKQRDDEKKFTEEVKAAYAAELKKDSDNQTAEKVAAPIEKFEWGEEKSLNKVEEAKNTEKSVEPVENSKPLEDFPLEKVFKPLAEVKAEAVAKALDNENAKPFEEPKPEENFPLQEAFKALEGAEAKKMAQAVRDDDKPFEEPKPEENFPLQETFKSLAEVKPEMLEKISKPTAELLEQEEIPLEEKIPEPTAESPKQEEKVPEPTAELPAQEEKVQRDEKLAKSLDKLSKLKKARRDEKVSKPAVESPEQEKVQREEKLAKSLDRLSKLKKAKREEKVPEPTVELPTQEEKILEPPIELPTQEEKIPEPPIELPAQEEKVPELAVELPTQEEKIPEPAVELPTQEETIPEPAVELPAQEEKVETLDDLLDKAYNARANGHVWQSIEFYRKALDRYRDDEYALFVAIDLGNLYKEHALYSKAIKTYEEALTLPAVKRNISAKKEFARNLEYLRVVRDILLKHRALSTPFGKISNEILQEIDVEFQATRIYSAQKK